MSRQHFVEFRQKAKLKLQLPVGRWEGETYVKNKKRSTICEIEPGSVCIATVTCRVVCEKGRYVEVADMLLHDGQGVLRSVPCAYFMFVDQFD